MVFCAVIMITVATVVFMIVTAGIWIIFQLAFRLRFRGFVRRVWYSRTQLDVCLGQRHLSSHTDAAADQHINLRLFQKACQHSVAATVGNNDLRIDYGSVLHIVQLELLRRAKMLECRPHVGLCRGRFRPG